MTDYSESSTPVAHIEAVKTAVETMLFGLDCVADAWVDDWGRYSNFATFIEVPTYVHRGPTRSVVKLRNPLAFKLAKKELTKQLKAVLPGVKFTFRPAERRPLPCKMRYSLDIDLQAYDPSTNSFKELV